MKRLTPQFVINAILLAVVLCAMQACRTVAPKPVTTTQASFDGNQQDSGIIALTVDGRAIVTSHWRDRYNAMLKQYGGAIQITTPDYGLTSFTNQTWLATAQAREYFAIWNQQRKNGK